MQLIDQQHAMMTSAEEDQSILDRLSDEEIAEAKESLHRYFEIGWQIATRLQQEGKLDEVLTKAGVFPIVKEPLDEASNQNSSQTQT